LHPYILKGVLAVDNALQLRAQIVSHMTGTYEGLGLRLRGDYLDFDGGRAIIKPDNDGLMFSIDANDILTGYGIRTLIEASLLDALPCGKVCIDWHQGENRRLEAVPSQIGAGRR
jgi:hypothetical protein